MKERILSSVIGALFVLPFIYFGGIPFAFFAGIVGILSAYEAAGLLEKMGFSPSQWITYLATFSFIFLIPIFGDTGILIVLISMSVLLFLEALIKRNFNVGFFGSTFFISLYIGFLLSRFILLREVPEYGLQAALLVLIAIWVNDIAAYLAGKNFGRRKLAPTVSPGKTVEGAAAGIISSLIAGFAFSFFIPLLMIEVIILSFVIAFMGQAGDLFESQLKRWAGVKDSGNAIPGHGGFLDRIDSLLFGSAAGYYMLQLFLL